MPSTPRRLESSLRLAHEVYGRAVRLNDGSPQARKSVNLARRWLREVEMTEAAQIEQQMEFDAFHRDPATPPDREECAWRVLIAEPADTNNAQCWSEEIFSLLNS